MEHMRLLRFKEKTSSYHVVWRTEISGLPWAVPLQGGLGFRPEAERSVLGLKSSFKNSPSLKNYFQRV